MARPRVFVSSTFYDLRHLRASLDRFVESLGFEPVLSEQGDIAYVHDSPLDESCYREVGHVDIFVLVIGGRYGSEAFVSRSSSSVASGRTAHKYESVTKKEFEAAVDRDIPCYVLIDHQVYAEYETYKLNKKSNDTKYAHVDNIQVFEFIESILSLSRNNPIKPFDKFEDAQLWLRDQWSGLFRDMLNRRTAKAELQKVANQVGQLADISKTMQKYMEEVLNKIKPQEAAQLIGDETARLRESNLIRNSHIFGVIGENLGLTPEKFVEINKESTSLNELLRSMLRLADARDRRYYSLHGMMYLIQLFEPNVDSPLKDLNDLRSKLGLTPYSSMSDDEWRKLYKLVASK